MITVQLPPFIATLGAMGIVRGAGFILTEGRYFDVSRLLAPGWRPLGIPLDWWPPVVMVVLALAFQLAMHRLQWGRAVYSVGGNETAALYSGISLGRIKTSVYLISATLAAVSGVVLVLVQGQGKADLAMGYELDIIAVGGRRRREPLGRARFRHRRGPRGAHLWRAAQRPGTDSRRHVL